MQKALIYTEEKYLNEIKNLKSQLNKSKND